MLSGCGITPEELKKTRPASLPQPKIPELKPGELPKITVVPGGTESYWNEARRGAEAAGKQFGARIEWKVPVSRIPHRSEAALYLAQKELVEETATTSQGLVVAPVDSTKMMQPVGKAARAGVVVVAFYRDVFTIQNKLTFVHNDEEKRADLQSAGLTPVMDFYQMGFQSVKAIMDFRATKEMPPREIKIAPRVWTKNTAKLTNRSTP